MGFLADAQILKDIMSMERLCPLPEALKAKRQAQAQELLGGCSARRSSIQEHRLINTILRQNSCAFQLKEQKGIEYTNVKGIRYRDTCFPFHNYYNKAQECYERYDEGDRDGGRAAWLAIGKMQKEVIWVLQFLCQEIPSFYPDCISFAQKNKRSLRLGDGSLVFSHQGGFISGLGRGSFLLQHIITEAKPKSCLTHWCCILPSCSPRFSNRLS